MEPVTGIPVDTTNILDDVNAILNQLVLEIPNISKINFNYDTDGTLQLDFVETKPAGQYLNGHLIT